ncbi:hypothetical protein F4861DRAFT_198626 [Xylaria intraflava]|nr:hypothetical protein F4861DRAFT_198626 [Xylaria intraflava]
MAPSSKGTNPAPNYAVMMNRVQTQIEAQLRTVRTFLPSKPPAQAQTTAQPTTKKATPSFSALASTSKPPVSDSTKPQQQAQRQNEENLFNEGYGQDPNAGLGFGAISKRSNETAKERESQILRSRLLGRKRGAEDSSGRAPRHRAGGEESSDEESGRGGLGRAKKRPRREEPRRESDGERSNQLIPESDVPESEPEKDGVAQSKDDVPADNTNARENREEHAGDGKGISSLQHDGSVQNGSENVSHQQKKRGKKKKKGGSKRAETR